MPSLKAIKRRISSVTSTQQIVKAMDMVSAAKLQKIRGRMQPARRMLHEANRMMEAVKHNPKAAANAFFTQREVKNTAYVVLSGDRGLCGSYNTNITKAVLSFIGDSSHESIIAVGLQGWQYLQARGKHILQGFTGISENAYYEDAVRVSDLLASLFLSGEIDEAYVAYTYFASALTYTPRIEKLLPFQAYDTDVFRDDTMEYEPDAESFAASAAPMYIRAFLYAALVEAAACEHAARMTSMHSASGNAEDIIEDLTREHNQKRQGAVTQELNEIVSGAKALRKRDP